MSFGPATFGLQQAILTLLQGRKPSPTAPVPLAPPGASPPRPLFGAPSYLTPAPLAPTGGIGPLSLETTAALAALQPEPVPPQLPGPVDADAIRARFAGLAGPEPVAPPEQPNPLILRIARALQGFGAGVQGQGPQFLAQLREQRERPQREFQAKKERFETRRQELGVMAEQEVGRAQSRTEERTQELLDRQFQREYSEGVRRLNLRDQKEQDLFRDALLAKRQREEDERQAEENRRKEAQQTKIELAKLASKYRAAGAKGEIATELAQKDLDPNFKLSPKATKWFSARVALEEARAAKAAGGGAARQPRVMVEIINNDGSTSIVPYSAVHEAIEGGQIGKETEGMRLGPRGIFMEGQQAQPAPAMPAAPRTFGELSVAGLPPNPAFAPQQEPLTRPGVFTRAQIKVWARKNKRDPATVEADLRANGHIVQ